tara:strand:- start:2846 stop:3076 length:231 start_codon:yes stop_codon:yes gene_type:complete
MKSLLLLVKNNLPYFLIIAIYFFLINLETKKENINKEIIINENELPYESKTKNEDKKYLRIQIPVIPYNEKNSPNI